MFEIRKSRFFYTTSLSFKHIFIFELKLINLKGFKRILDIKKGIMASGSDASKAVKGKQPKTAIGKKVIRN